MPLTDVHGQPPANILSSAGGLVWYLIKQFLLLTCRPGGIPTAWLTVTVLMAVSDGKFWGCASQNQSMPTCRLSATTAALPVSIAVATPSTTCCQPKREVSV